MAEILALELSDEDYARLIAQGRDPVLEQRCAVMLISHLKVPVRTARWLASLPLSRFLWFFLQSPMLTARAQRRERRWQRDRHITGKTAARHD